MANLFDINNAVGSPVSTDPGTGVQVLLERVVNLMLDVAIPLAFIGIVYTAWQVITSAGKPDAYGAARKNIAYIATGIFILTLGLWGVKLIYTIFGNH
jgi:hypothetical protein